MTTTEHPTDPTAVVTTCPTWCAGKHDPDDEGVTFHSRPVGGLGVVINAHESPDGTIGDALIYVPETHEMLADGMSDDITPERAALLEQAMLLAVAIIDGGLR